MLLIIYVPCDVKPFPKPEKFQNTDVLIIGNIIVGDIWKDGFVLKKETKLSFEECSDTYNIYINWYKYQIPVYGDRYVSYNS